MSEVSKWADSAMFRSEPMPVAAKRSGPQVILLNATPDPLGSLAALCSMYTGRVVRSLSEMTDDERRSAYTEVTKNKLQGPLEVVQFHFLVEGVTRAFTHQMVRERQAFFAQESMRFAVPEEDWVNSGRVPYPPSVATGEELARNSWDDAVNNLQSGYQQLIDLGIPAEDARGLMPHSITTRLHWVTDLRGLLYVAGLRLCTQAQFEWRHVMANVVKALRSFRVPSGPFGTEQSFRYSSDNWQFQIIADSLKPICYQEGRCGFKAKMDRPCVIRDRVDANERAGRDSSEWDQSSVKRTRTNPTQNYDGKGNPIIEAIQPYEWAADHTAARKK